MKTAIYDKFGKKIAGDVSLNEALSSHILSKEFPLIENGKLYTLLSDGSISVLCAEESILESFIEKKDIKRLTKGEFLRSLLFGEANSDMVYLCSRYGIHFDDPRRVYVAQVSEDVSEYVLPLEELFEEENIIVVGLDSHRIAVICVEGDNDTDEMADAISATFQDLNSECYIGVSCIADNASALSGAFQQALCAIELGKKISFNGGVWFYSDILPELIISQMPKEALDDLKDKAYKVKRSLDNENVEVAMEFFKHNLNISETAKCCFLHRNTLINRLDKIQKDTGFNMRNFHEAVALRLYIAANKVFK